MTTRLATNVDFAAVAALRLAAYRAAPQFTIADEAAVTRWDGQVLVAETPDLGLIATMQAIACETLEQLRTGSGSLPPNEFNALPTLLLNRGATLPGLHYRGLNSRLRMAALDMALADERIQSLTGFMYAGALRLNLLRELGYTFVTVAHHSCEHITGNTAEYFVVLQRAQFAQASKRLTDLL